MHARELQRIHGSRVGDIIIKKKEKKSVKFFMKYHSIQLALEKNYVRLCAHIPTLHSGSTYITLNYLAYSSFLKTNLIYCVNFR